MLMNIVTRSFDTTVRQMTEMTQRKKKQIWTFMSNAHIRQNEKYQLSPQRCAHEQQQLCCPINVSMHARRHVQARVDSPKRRGNGVQMLAHACPHVVFHVLTQLLHSVHDVLFHSAHKWRQANVTRRKDRGSGDRSKSDKSRRRIHDTSIQLLIHRSFKTFQYTTPVYKDWKHYQ